MNKECFYDLVATRPPTQDIDIEFWPLFENQIIPLKPSIILEVGVERGNSGFLFSKICEENNGFYIGIDIGFGGLQPSLILEAVVPICLIKGDSTKENTVKKLEMILGNKKADMLYIDASHDIDDVYSDIKNYVPFVKKDGLVAFHDYRTINEAIIKAKNDGLIKYIKDGVYHGNMGTYYFYNNIG